jgi:hypothetical protein
MSGEKTNKFSTKVENNNHFADTREILQAELCFFDYKTRVDQVVKDCPTRLVHYILDSQKERIYEEFERNISIIFNN